MEKKNKNYSAMTIIEMLVAIMIFTLGIGGFSLLFTQVWSGNSYTLEMGQSSMAVSEGVNRMVNYLRGSRQADSGAYPIVSAADNDLVIYSDYDKDTVTERLHFYKSGNQILMGYRDPSSGMPKTYAAGDQATVVLANSIVNGAGSPVFSYYDKNYSGGEGQTFLATPANPSDIRLVKIHLYININPNRAPDNIQLQSFVELRNLNDYKQIK